MHESSVKVYLLLEVLLNSASWIPSLGIVSAACSALTDIMQFPPRWPPQSAEHRD